MKYIKIYELFIRPKEYQQQDWDNLKKYDWVFISIYDTYEQVIDITDEYIITKSSRKLLNYWNIKSKMHMKIKNIYSNTEYTGGISSLQHFITKENWDLHNNVKKFNV